MTLLPDRVQHNYAEIRIVDDLEMTGHWLSDSGPGVGRGKDADHIIEFEVGLTEVMA